MLRYTPREYGQKFEGWKAQQARERYGRAELACWLLAPHCECGKVPKPDELLGTVRGEDL